MRKIVQISTWTLGETCIGVVALCDDGTLWDWTDTWKRIPDIPQDEPVEPDPILELEAKGGGLTGDDGYIVWGVPTGQITFEEGEGMFGSVTIAEIRESAAALLAKLDAKEAK